MGDICNHFYKIFWSYFRITEKNRAFPKRLFRIFSEHIPGENFKGMVKKSLAKYVNYMKEFPKKKILGIFYGGTPRIIS